MPKAPTVLQGKGFSSGDLLSLEVVKSLTCLGPGDAATPTLVALGWRKKIAGCVVLSFTNDNERVERGCFSLVGESLGEPAILQAKKLWPEAEENVFLSLELPAPNMLSFPQTLVSEYIDSEVLVHSFVSHENGKEELIPAAEFDDYGIENFCVRGFIVPTASYARLHLLIYPESKTSIKEHALWENPKWPGFALWEGQFNLFPASSTKKLKWGCPILPLMIPGASLDVLATYPPELDLLAAITSLMRSAVIPHALKLGMDLQTKYTTLDADGAGSLDVTGLVSIWPLPRPREQAAASG